MRSSLPESEGHRAKVPPLESPMPEEWAQRAEQADQDCDIWKAVLIGIEGGDGNMVEVTCTRGQGTSEFIFVGGWNT
eukprot:4246728-Pleurochrysis_carterae.AAC.1